MIVQSPNKIKGRHFLAAMPYSAYKQTLSFSAATLNITIKIFMGSKGHQFQR